MRSNIIMTLVVGLYLGFTAFTLTAFQAHRHSTMATAASLNLPR